MHKYEGCDQIGGRLTIAVLVLAAGRSTRTGGSHKLLATFDGIPLIRRSVLAACGSACDNVVVVTGHLDDEIRSVIEDIPAQVVHNSDFESGMATSIIVGLREAIRFRAAGVMICLSDMPDLTSEHLDLLATRFRQCDGKPIVRAVAGGKPGHPIIFPDSTYPELVKLAGDVGARAVVRRHRMSIVDVEIGPAARMDLDTLESLRERGWLPAQG
ncbi:nucleotidyltransferase family protein (plasmid) [Agrobacterium tumefaciens]|uniref:nucleotidyltransferase family protein n=1 Tax=Agrobacterium TaxID=357 RepID=UPI0009BB615D|nr:MULTISPECIES: nucleotidyltransferase family protein [Agrobacterium]RVT69951.1 nucleotidyltransferase family protein [Agrobacterium sp. CNPSo 2736]UXT23975.1 nucleotidyltransferase family protein [Agrobacterium tumefaciens]